MKFIIYCLILCSLNGFSQKKLSTKTGSVDFEASVVSFEEVKASNHSVTAILNTENGEFAALVLMKGFRFKNALMEEHFNENYVESDQYPKATFKGTIEGFNYEALRSNATYKIFGELELHGKTKKIEDVMAKVSKNGNNLSITGNFKVKPADFNIDIPKIVSNKIAEEIVVSFNFLVE